MATSTGLFIAVRALGGTAGSTIVLAVFTSKISKQLPSRIIEAALKAGVKPAALPAIIAAGANFDVEALAAHSGLPPAAIPEFVGAVLGAVQQGTPHHPSTPYQRNAVNIIDTWSAPSILVFVTLRLVRVHAFCLAGLLGGRSFCKPKGQVHIPYRCSH